MANVLHKTTFQYLTSRNTTDYMDGNWLINPDLSAVQGISTKYWKINGNNVLAMSVGEKDSVDISDLDGLKLLAYASIDRKTDVLISLGHTYTGEQFSLSSESQTTTLGLYVGRALLAYPITANNKDDTATVSIENTTDVENFFLNAIGTVRAHLDSGSILKDSVRAASTKSELDAIKDGR